MSSGLKVYFFLYESRTNKKGTAPLILRLKYQNQTAQVSTGFQINPKNWLPEKYQVKSTDKDCKLINQHLNDLKVKVHQHFSAMFQNGDVYLQEIMDCLRGVEHTPVTLLRLVKEYNDRVAARVGIDYKPGTLIKYRITEKKLCDFVESGGVKDIRLKDLKKSFIEDFNTFMKVRYSNDQNTTCKHLKNLKSYVKYAIGMEYLVKSPFVDYKVSYRAKEKPYLSMTELRQIEEKCFSIKRLELVKDLFLLQCYTGLSFIDLATLKGDNLTQGIDGNFWIIKNREKTDVRSAIPLLPNAKRIIEKYNPEYKTLTTETILPSYNIQKYNSYLKEIADCCGIIKNLSSHAGRRTFASTVALGNGVSIETIAQILGHTTTKITHEYARVSDMKIATEMDTLKNMF